MADRELIIVDTETTGLSEESLTVEVAALNMHTLERVSFVPHHDLESPDAEVVSFALDLNGYTRRSLARKMLNSGDTIYHWNVLANMLSGNTFAGCNPAFDFRRLPDFAQTSHHRLADVSAYCGALLGRTPTNLPGLADLIDIAGIDQLFPAEVLHGALADCYATAAVFAAFEGDARKVSQLHKAFLADNEDTISPIISDSVR